MSEIRLLTVPNALMVVAFIAWMFMAWWRKYRKWWWYDNVAHVLGGFTIGMLAAGGRLPLVRAVGWTLAATLVWEAYEYARGLFPWKEQLPFDRSIEDTILDTIFALFGAGVAALVFVFYSMP